MSILLHQEPLPFKPGPQPNTDFEQALQLAVSNPSINLEKAPSLLDEWVGREECLTSLDQDWTDPECKIVGLIGFGGEGKTSIVRHWIEHLLRTPALPRPKGIFWWGFYEQSNVDEFFEAALNFLSGEQVDLNTLPSAYAKANFLAGMLRAGRYLFILDGIEVLQHQGGDEYGLLINNSLLEFLNYFAASDHQSFCLITSRAPLYDLIHYITYTHRDVNHLSKADGRRLLRKVGVKGKNTRLDRIVAQWDGHALTLSLLGSYLVKQHGGDIEQLPKELAPMAHEDKYDRVERLLRRYDEHLLIEILLARGKWAARQGEVEAARSDLDEALGYATCNGYRLYEIDILIGLAWIHLNEGNPSTARTEAERSRCLSKEISYYWGQVDAVEVLEAVNKQLLQ